MQKSTNRTAAAMFLTATLVIVTLATLSCAGAYGMNLILTRTCSIQLFTFDEFKNCVQTITIVLFVTVIVPLVTMAAGYYITGREKPAR